MPTVRHSGPVHVRGKIRRVWRLRHLELWDNGYVCYYHHTNNKEHHSTLRILEARLLDGTTLRDLHVGIPKGRYGWAFRGQRVYHSCGESNRSPLDATPRDFWCAVETLEEAQLWVVALQWAAQQPVVEVIDPWWIPTATTTKHLETNSHHDDDDWEPASLHSRSSSKERLLDPQPTGTMVVTQVVSFRYVRVSTFSWQVAFDIRGICLHPSATVQEWRLLRTADDLERLVTQLCHELGPAWLEQTNVVGAIRQLPRYRWPSSSTLTSCNAILQSLVLEVVQAQAMLHFLGLDENERPSVVVSKQSLSREQFVQAWLKEQRKQSASSTSMTLPSVPWMWLGGLGTAALALKHVPSVAVRLDVLVASWIGAAYLGRKYWATSATSTKAPPTRTPKPTTQEMAPSIPRVPSHDESEVLVHNAADDLLSAATLDDMLGSDEDDTDEGDDVLETPQQDTVLSSPLPEYPSNGGVSCWSRPPCDIFYVRGASYLQDKVKVPSGEAPLICRGVDVWLTDNPQRHIARHPSVLGGRLGETDTFLLNFLLPFGNFVSYFEIPPLSKFPFKLRDVWTKFLKGDQQYRDARLKLLPVVVEGPWIVKAAVGPGKSPALLGKVIPLQYYFREADKKKHKAVYEVDVLITASSIAKGILSVVKGHTKSVSIAFAVIIEGTSTAELPETVLCCFQLHSLHLEDCPVLSELHVDDL